MKIAILTIHSAHNYGAMLQAYATRMFLTKQGFEADVINYRPSFIDYPYKAINLHRILRSKRPKYLIPAIYNEIRLYRLRKLRRKRFEVFFCSFVCPNNPDPVTDIPSDYDVYIVGSDQVWNTDITLKYEDPYFAKFPFPHENKRYLSYASSIGKENLDEQTKKELSKRLENFDILSVREESAKLLLQPFINKDIHVVLDPTLLLKKEEWEKVCSKKGIKEKYVLVYQIEENKEVLNLAYKISKTIGGRVFQLVAWPNKRLSDEENLQGPQDFLSLIRNASFIVTTSFHGTAFSLIFEKDFFVVRLNNGKDGRAANLLSMVKLQNRIVDLNEDVSYSKVDYSEARDRLCCKVLQSQEFLINSIYGKG